MQWERLYKERNPSRKRGEHSTKREREREREKKKLKFTVKESALTINDQPLLGPARGRIYIEFVSLSFILTALVLLSSNL